MFLVLCYYELLIHTLEYLPGIMIKCGKQLLFATRTCLILYGAIFSCYTGSLQSLLLLP
jgi:hypothetical protein